MHGNTLAFMSSSPLNRLVWILEDDPGMRAVISQSLASEYRVQEFSSIEAFEEALKNSERPDLLLADLRLGEGSFLNFLQRREAPLSKEFPFFVITGSDDRISFEQCMAMGASDFLTKPFGKAALAGKVGLLLGQNAPFGLDPATFVATHHGRRSKTLTSKEFQILSTLRSAPGMAMTRQEIQDSVWSELHVGNKTFDVHLYNLRRKISGIGITINFDPPHTYRVTVSG